MLGLAILGLVALVLALSFVIVLDRWLVLGSDSVDEDLDICIGELSSNKGDIDVMLALDTATPLKDLSLLRVHDHVSGIARRGLVSLGPASEDGYSPGMDFLGRFCAILACTRACL